MALAPVNVSIWMPITIGDYLASTQRFTTEQHGAYVLILLDYWRNGPPPASDTVLQNITKLTPRGWAKNREAVLSLFEVRDGKLYQERIEADLANARKQRTANTDRARHAAKKRWSPDGPFEGAPSNAPSMLGACPSPAPSSSPSATTATASSVTNDSLPRREQAEAIGTLVEGVLGKLGICRPDADDNDRDHERQ